MFNSNVKDIAVVYAKQYKNRKALQFYEKALKIQQKVLGVNHPDVAHTMGKVRVKKKLENQPKIYFFLANIGLVYREERNYQKAKENLTKYLPSYLYCFFCCFFNYNSSALSIFEKTVGKNHMDYANALKNLGAIQQLLQNYEEAYKCYTEALNTLKVIKKVIKEEKLLKTSTPKNFSKLLYISLNSRPCLALLTQMWLSLSMILQFLSIAGEIMFQQKSCIQKLCKFIMMCLEIVILIMVRDLVTIYFFTKYSFPD